MPKQQIAYDEYFQQVNRILASTGLLLASGPPDRPTNAMAIGWGSLGRVWGRPMWVVLVRPSRFTYQLIEEAGDFSVNVMPNDMADVVTHCGTVSGRDEEKCRAKDLSAVPGLRGHVPIIGESSIAYECRTVATNDIIPEKLDAKVTNTCYPSGDFHRVFYGEILCVRAEKEILTH